MTVYQTVFALFGVFVLIGTHQTLTKLFKLLDGHLERLQEKLDVLLVAQIEHNQKIDKILAKLF